jgi:hypothetical protein
MMYELRLWPDAMLPLTPAGRLEMLCELASPQTIDGVTYPPILAPQEALALLETPTDE